MCVGEGIGEIIGDCVGDCEGVELDARDGESDGDGYIDSDVPYPMGVYCSFAALGE